ncbi:MAG TPA: TPM domain-containing protein [Polyangiaceae bacterium]|nr:TPM domain-containing protein [Polyangiaceae bacterium]
MFGLTRKRVHELIDVAAVEAAIAAAERRTSGEIRVSVAPWFWGSVDRAAEAAFVRLGMNQTRARNGVLFFVVPSRQTFLVRGDTAIHERVGQAFWDELVAAMSAHFRRGEFTQGLVLGVAAAGEQLATHFPYDAAADKNELPDDVDIS